jgi:hypothetical protein
MLDQKRQGDRREFHRHRAQLNLLCNRPSVVAKASKQALIREFPTPSFLANVRGTGASFACLGSRGRASFQRKPPVIRGEDQDRYQDAVCGAVVRHGGYVANFLGDGIIAYFGWPHADEDNAGWLGQSLAVLHLGPDAK